MIRTLGPNELIRANGFYRLPLERHHSQPCEGVSVTSGVLRQMELATPADVWAFHMLNPDRWERKETDALRMGVAMALYVEGGAEGVLTGFSLHDEPKPRRPTPAQVVAYESGGGTDAGVASVEYWRAVDADPQSYLTAEEFTEICVMGAVLARDPVAAAVMAGEPEITMAWHDEETNLWILSRPDTVSFDGAVSDYKRMATRGSPFSWRVVDQRITDHGYDMQLALAAEAYERITGERPTSAGIVAQWVQAPHHVILRGFSDDDLVMAQFRNRRALRTFRRCLDSGHWPGPGEDVGNYRRPQWQAEMIMADMAAQHQAPEGIL
jgi:hypothetical protein